MTNIRTGGATLALTGLFLFCPLTHAEHHPATSAEDVEVTRSGGINMYRYRDENGQMVVVDTPPPQFFNVKKPVDVEPEVEVEPEAPPVIEAPPPAPQPAGMSWLMKLLWAATAGLLLGALATWLTPAFRRWRTETAVDKALRLAEMPVFRDVKVSGVGGRYVMAERIARTPAGLVVLGMAKLSGELRGAPGAQQWVRGTTPVPNPLKPVEQCVEFLQQIVPDVPVSGRVVDLGKASFVAGKPEALQNMTEFKASIDDWKVPGPATRTLDGAWRELMKLPRSDAKTVRPVGTGPVGWVRRNPHQAGAAALGSLGLVMAITLLVMQLL